MDKSENTLSLYDIEYLKELSKKIKEQQTSYTQRPCMYEVRYKERIIDIEDNCGVDGFEWYDPDNTEAGGYDDKDLCDVCRSILEDKGYEKSNYRFIDKIHRVFFTMKAAKNYIEKFFHQIPGESPFIYVENYGDCAEIINIIDIICKF